MGQGTCPLVPTLVPIDDRFLVAEERLSKFAGDKSFRPEVDNKGDKASV